MALSTPSTTTSTRLNVRRPVAWLSAFALLASGLIVAQQVAAPDATAAAPAGMTTSPGPLFTLSSPWLPAGASPHDYLFVTGNNASLGSANFVDDEGARPKSNTFIGYWQGDGGTAGDIANPWPTYAAGYGDIDNYTAPNGWRGNANYQGRMSAIDSGDYVGTAGYVGNGASLYVWSFDAQDYWVGATGHPAEFTDSMIGYRPGKPQTEANLCRPSGWGQDNKGSWISVIEYPAGSVEGTVFWVPNPRAADFMSVYKAAHADYPGTYDVARDPSWPCTTDAGLYHDGWGGGEVIQSTGEIFFTGRQSAKLDTTYRAMIFNPKTGAFAASGLLQPADPDDGIFGAKAAVAGDLMVDGDGNGYVIAEGRAPAGSVWHDPNDLNPTGSQRAYLLRIVPTPNPAYNPSDPNSMRYLHNGGWKYNIVQRIYSDPTTGNTGNLYSVFGRPGKNSADTSAQAIKGSNWFNGLLYAANNNDLFVINPMSGRAQHVPADKSATVNRLLPNQSSINLNPRDMATGQEALTIDGVVFYDENGDGTRQDGEWGVPGVQLALYSDLDEDGVWTLETDPGQRNTGSSGEYTMFLSSYGTYQIRVVSPDFNPNADPASATFEADVRKDTVAAVQTSASSGRSTHTSTLGQTLENKVTAHCYDYAADKVVAVVDQTLITQPNGTQTDRPCAGNLKQPFTDGPYADGATPTVGSPFTSPTTQAAIYSTLTITNSHLVPDADFGLATLTSYKVGAVSDGDTDTFTVAGQALTTTAEGVQATSGDIGPVTPGAQTTAVQLPSDDWTVSQVEVKSGNTVVATPAYSPTDATHGTFQWTLPPNSDLTAVVHFLKDLACDPGQSELAVTPDGPIEAGASYTLTVTAKDKNGDRCRDRTAVTFGAAPAGPTFSSVTCTTSAVTGVCSVQATSTKAGTFALSAQMADPATGLAADIKNSPTSRQWTHATCHADSSLVMVPASASVRETSVATLRVVDEYNNPCDDVSPVLSDTDGLDFALSSGPGSAADDPDKSQSAQGVYTWPMTSETPGTFNPVATLPANPAFREEAEVTYYDEDVSPTNSSFTAVADDGALPVYVEESYTVTAVLRNASDQPLSGHDVDFTAPGVTFTPASCTTDAQGTCSVVATTTAPAHKSGTFAIVAKTGTLTLNPNTADWQKGNGDRYPAPAPPNIRFWGGPGIDNARLTVDPDHQTAGSDVSVRIEALDKYDNPVTDLVEADLTLVGDPVDPATNPPIGPNPGSFDDSGAASGVFYFSTTSKLIGEFVLTGTGRGQTIKDHPHVWFTAGPVCTVNCEPVDPTHQTRIEMLNNGALANGKDKDTARSWAYDHYGNPVEGALTVSSRAPSSPDLMPATQQVAAGPDGTADLAWTSSKGGVYTAVNTIDGQSAFPGSALDNIRFVDTPVDVSKSTLDITPGKADRPIPAGDAYTAKVTAVDVDGRPVTGVPVQFDAQPKAGTTPRHPLELSNTGCTTGADGSCSITVTGKSAGEYTIWAKVSDPATGAMTDVGGGGDPDRRSPQDVSWKAGDICVPSADKTCDPDPDFQTSVRVTRNDQPGDGVSTDEATLKGFDAYGNPVPGAPWTSAKAQAGDPLTVVTPAGTLGADGQSVISYSATADGSYQADVAAAGQTVPGSPVTLRFTHAPGTCTMDKTPADGVQAGGAYTITTRCTNQAGVPDAGKAVAHRTDSPDLSFVAGLSTCTTDPLGTCSVQVTATVAGTYEVDYVDPPASTVVGAPVQVTFVAGPPSELSATHVLKNGALADGTDQDRVQVVAFDQYGNRVAGAQVTTSTAKAGLAIQPNIPPTDQQGEVLIWYTSVVATTYPVDFKVGDAVPTGGDGSPVTLGFTAGAVAKVTLDVDPAGPIIVGKDPENTYTLTGTALDKEDNPVAGALIQFKLNPEAGPTYVGNNRTCVTGASGECTAQVYSTKAGSYSATAESGNVISTAKDVVWLPDKVCGVECTPDADTPSNLYTRVEVTRDGAVADGRDADQVRLWAYDKWGNAVPNQLVETTPDSPSLLPMANIPVTGDGLRGTTAGVSDISYFATAGGVYHPDIKVGLPGEMRTPRGLPVSLTFIGLKSDPPVIETVDGDDVTGGKTGLTNDPTPEIAGTGVTGDKLEVWDGL
ncbi:MAG: Ig-like domain-containing protein, partial [Propionibacteriaceae bacterium]|nr:Ig-like domain-containing protein [Propionibacteriaceae bacterium]